MSVLISKPERFSRKPENQYTGRNAIQYTEKNDHQPKQHRIHPDLHQKKADQISGRHGNLIGSTLHLCIDIVRLQQIIQCQVMDGEKDTHGQNRNQ